MGRNGWLDVVKKAFSKQIYTTKTRRNREEPESSDQHKKNKRRRWILSKTSSLGETTTIYHLHDESNNVLSNTTKTSAVEPTNSCGKHKQTAAIIIQTSFRGYLAKRAVEALKGVVKLQALVRGQNVRMRAKMTLKCMQALIRVQTRVCEERRRKFLNQAGSSIQAYYNNLLGSHYAHSNFSTTREEEWNRRAYITEEVRAMLHKLQVAAAYDPKMDANFFHQIWSSDHQHQEESDNNFDLNQRDPLTDSERSPNWKMSKNQQKTLNKVSSPLHRPHESPLSNIKPSCKVDSASCRRSEERNLPTTVTGMVGKPSNYMSATASAMARSQRIEKGKKTSARKRLSFNNISREENIIYRRHMSLDAGLSSPIVLGQDIVIAFTLLTYPHLLMNPET